MTETKEKIVPYLFDNLKHVKSKLQLLEVNANERQRRDELEEQAKAYKKALDAIENARNNGENNFLPLYSNESENRQINDYLTEPDTREDSSSLLY